MFMKSIRPHLHCSLWSFQPLQRYSSVKHGFQNSVEVYRAYDTSVQGCDVMLGHAFKLVCHDGAYQPYNMHTMVYSGDAIVAASVLL